MFAPDHRIKRVVEFGDGSFGVEECIGCANWVASTPERFPSEEQTRKWIGRNTVKRVLP